MLNGLSFIFNFSDKGKISCERMDNGVFKGSIKSQLDAPAIDLDWSAKDIFDFFVKLAKFTDENIDYLKFKHAFSSLIAIDKMVLKKDGECSAISRSRGVCYTENYNSHKDFLSYLNTLKEQISNFDREASYYLPLKDIKEEDINEDSQE